MKSKAAYEREYYNRQLHSRELLILHLIAAGLDNTEIGQHLFLGTNTVKTYVHRIMRVLGARSRTHAVHIAHLSDILPGEAPPVAYNQKHFRKMYVFDEKVINEQACRDDAMRCVTAGKEKRVEIHKHTSNDQCALPVIDLVDYKQVQSLEQGRCYAFTEETATSA